ncbi:MAG: amino acid permease [Pseudomonadota bacterium]
MTEHTATALNRTLTLPLLTLYGLGVTVGAGIYVLVGQTAAVAGAYAPFAFLVAAVAMGFTAFSYTELSTRLPVAAGVAAYVDAGLRQKALATVLGLTVALSGVVSAGAVALGAAGYLGALTGLPAPVLCVAVVVLMAVIAWWGITESVTIAAIITAIELGGLVLVICWAAFVADPAGLPLPQMVPPLTGPHWTGILIASVLAFYAFVGFEDMVNVVEEVRAPLRTIPRAIAITLVVTVLLYVGVMAAVLVAVPLADLIASDAPLLLVFQDGPESLRAAFGLIAVLATVNGVLIQIIMASRVLYGMARRGQLPRVLAQVSPRTQTPAIATALVAAVIVTLSLAFPIGALAAGTSQIVLTIFLFVNASLIAIKWRGDPAGPHFAVPFAVPVLGIATSAAMLAFSLM